MSLHRITTILTALTGAAVVFIGLRFLLDPQGAASGFGIAPWPRGNAAGYFVVKGVRDGACGAIVLILLALRQRRALGWVLLTDAIIPIGDAISVLTHGGPPATAYGVHGATAALVVVLALLFLREGPARAPLPQTA